MFAPRALSIGVICLGVWCGTIATAQDLVIGYITRSLDDPVWALIDRGAADAAQKADVSLLTIDPAFTGDLTTQLEMFENLISRRVAAIAVGPASGGGIAPAVDDAMDAGIPVVALKHGVAGAPVSALVATDTYAMSKLQGAVAATAVEDGGSIIHVGGNPKRGEGLRRHAGFMETFRIARPNTRVIEITTDWNPENARREIEQALTRDRDVRLIVAAWEGGTQAAVSALQARGIPRGRIPIFGFEGTPATIAGLEEGWVRASTAELAYRIGYQGMQTAIAAARGEAVRPFIDTGYFLVTPETLDVYRGMVALD